MKNLLIFVATVVPALLVSYESGVIVSWIASAIMVIYAEHQFAKSEIWRAFAYTAVGNAMMVFLYAGALMLFAKMKGGCVEVSDFMWLVLAYGSIVVSIVALINAIYEMDKWYKLTFYSASLAFAAAMSLCMDRVITGAFSESLSVVAMIFLLLMLALGYKVLNIDIKSA